MTTRRRLSIRLLLPATSALALALAPVSSLAAEPAAPTSASPTVETTTSMPGPESSAVPPAGSTTESTQTTPTTTTTPLAAPTSEAPEAAIPQVQSQRAQGSTAGAPTSSRAHAKRSSGHSNPGAGNEGAAESTEGPSSALVHANAKRTAPSPSTLTPPLPLALGSSIAGVPGFFIESFRIPPFLLPIYQAAGTAYGIPWQVLAAINEVETDYGRDLSVSSAGAEGWMQFLPTEWEQYGVDANGDGFKDPYNPADAIFTAARYLRAAGGDQNIKAAVFSYNHSAAYVDSVMLRAQLLGGTPPELLGAITGLTEARFPVHAPSHFSDGFATVPTGGGSGQRMPHTLVGTTIYTQAGVPVIATQDGEIVQIGDSSSLGRFISLRDAFGNTYVYAQLGSVATLYPVLQPHEHTTVSTRIAQPGGASEPAPSGPATAGAQPRSPVSEGAAVSGFALGAPASLESAPSIPSPALATPALATPAPAVPAPRAASPRTGPPAAIRVFRAGPDDVYLHRLLAGVQVLAGTVLGHVGGAGASTAAGEQAQPHMFFQIRPAGAGAPLIDPKPVLDGWVALENTSIFRAKGENPFLATSPTVGQVLLESQAQLQPQVLHDSGIHLGRCGKADVQTGRVDRRLLATLEFLSVSGLKPTVAGLECARSSPLTEGNVPASSSGDAVDVVAVNGIPIAGHQGPGSIADITVRKLLMLQGASRPRRIVSLMSYPGAAGALAEPSARDDIRISFSSLSARGAARTAGTLGQTLSPDEWIKLIARLGEIPDPTVAGKPSAAAIPDTSSPSSVGAREANGGR
jgi:murein DD-endopeptidase MepM/ murein hydrolase activator NlpD